MIVLCVTNCPQNLRGDLSKWLSEVNTGVYVGRLSARVREELWDRVCGNIKSGQATMVYTANNEQGFVFLAHNTTWTPVDYEGITLMRKPLVQNESDEEVSFLKAGFSKAAKYEKARVFGGRKSSALLNYVIIDVETTGLDFDNDRIIEIGMLKVNEGDVEELQCFVQSDLAIPSDITKLTGITDEMIITKGVKESVAFDKVQEFIGDSLVLGYNVQFDLTFLRKLGERVGKDIIIKRIKDVMSISRQKLDDVENYKLETVANYFSLDVNNQHRALADCKLTYQIYSELNKL